MISTHRLLVNRGMLQWVQCLLICAVLAGCAAPPPEPALVVPNTGAQGASSPAVEPSKAVFRVMEYPLVEQSTDNPDHPAFAERAIQAVANRRAGISLFSPVNVVEAPNQALAQYGYQIAPSATAPFSTYVLTFKGTPLVNNIARFWPMDQASEEGYLLVVETISGDLIAASESNIETLVSGLALEGDRLAYAGSAPMLRSGNAASTAVSGAIIQQEIGGKTLALYNRDWLAHLSYAGQELPYTYDAVVSGSSPESAMFNPGATGRLIWFYALRDGLWYYVEAGLME